MIDHTLRVALCHSATARAHLAGAEAAELEAQADVLHPVHPGSIQSTTWDEIHALQQCAAAARRRYWREVGAVQLLMGHRWPEAEALGVEP